jgi:ABC-type thiamine transport system ATPase subunit
MQWLRGRARICLEGVRERFARALSAQARPRLALALALLRRALAPLA